MGTLMLLLLQLQPRVWRKLLEDSAGLFYSREMFSWSIWPSRKSLVQDTCLPETLWHNFTNLSCINNEPGFPSDSEKCLILWNLDQGQHENISYSLDKIRSPKTFVGRLQRWLLKIANGIFLEHRTINSSLLKHRRQFFQKTVFFGASQKPFCPFLFCQQSIWWFSCA